MASLRLEISNQETADIRSVRTDVPGTLATVINKVPMKNVGKPSPSGVDFFNTLKVYPKPRS